MCALRFSLLCIAISGKEKKSGKIDQRSDRGLKVASLVSEIKQSNFFSKPQ